MPGRILEGVGRDMILVASTGGAAAASYAEILGWLPHIAMVVTIGLMTGRLFKVILEIYDWFAKRRGA